MLFEGHQQSNITFSDDVGSASLHVGQEHVHNRTTIKLK